MNLLVASILIGLTSLGPTQGHTNSASPEAAVQALQPGARRLLQRLAKINTLTASFVERKSLALLAAPVENHGVLVFRRGKRGPELARHILRPHASSVVIRRGKLRFGDAQGRESIDLASNPAVRTFVDSFLLVLAGDEPGLSKLYAMAYAEGPKVAGEVSWTLTLRPRDKILARVISELKVDGRGVLISSMLMKEVGGDESLTKFDHTRIDPQLGPGERRELFSVSPARTSLEGLTRQVKVR